MSLYYAKGQCSGYVSHDQFCFDKNSNCMDRPLDFLLIDQSWDMDGDKFGGIIGLAPKSGDAHLPGFME